MFAFLIPLFFCFFIGLFTFMILFFSGTAAEEYCRGKQSERLQGGSSRRSCCAYTTWSTSLLHIMHVNAGHLKVTLRHHFVQGGIVVASLVSINEVNLRWAWLVLGWVTVSGFDSWRQHFILVCNQPPRSTQLSTLRGTVKWIPAKGRWCSAAGE